ncbi:protein HIDE1 isoform X1 [Manis pentadactyla]|uniref:protein HIDE1 isoform X1 n=2 Tax=Manis pentadactyla TaxID=143292 RepID=UPI00255C5A62|nr:protein HIDE1 isoform X1 [Manis pentadactyla]
MGFPSSPQSCPFSRPGVLFGGEKKNSPSPDPLVHLSLPSAELWPPRRRWRQAVGRAGPSQTSQPNSGEAMPWTVLLFAAGSLAIPAPSILLMPPYPSSPEDPIHITCMAPNGFPGANFTLYCGGQVVQLLQAPADQLRVTFNLSSGRDAPGGTFRCQYGVLGEHRQPQLSDLSESVQVSFLASAWILALCLSLAGALLLLIGLVTVAVVVRKVTVKRLQKKRERESCWAQVAFTNTDMSFDNSLFAISMKMSEENAATLDACSGSAETPGHVGPRKRPTSTSSSPEIPEFSTFRACQ